MTPSVNVAMCPLFSACSTTSTRGSAAASSRATSALPSPDASSMILTRTSTPSWSSTLRTAVGSMAP